MNIQGYINNFTKVLLPAISVLILLLVPQWTSEGLMFPTQSGKFFLFVAGVLLLMFWYLIIYPKNRHISISWLDIFIAIFICYQISITRAFTTIEFFEFTGLIVFYIVLRSFPFKYISYLLLFTTIATVVQAIYGNLQLHGLLESHHSAFNITGSFFNPGPYAGYLVSVLPIAIGLFLYTKGKNNQIQIHETGEPSPKAIKRAIILFKSHKRIIFNYLSVIAIAAILLVLPASNSRAAWLAAVVSTGYLLYKYYSNGSVKLFPANNNLFNLYNKYTAHTYIKVASIALITIVMCTAALGLYNMKKDSADGRMLIWNVTGDIIKEKPVFGHGAGAFQAKYMEYQGKYFSANPNSNKAILAANNKYAFNEPLRIIAESGSVGFILILLALASLFRNKNNIASNKKQKPINSTGYLLLARATILSVLVFGMFSYPSKILPIKINLVLATAIVAGFQNPIKNSRRWKPVLRKITTTTLSATPVIPSPFFFRIALSVLSIIFLITASNVLLIKYSAFKIWKTAYTTYITGNYNKSINIYATAYPELKTNGSFLINYGKALSMAEEHKKAIEILKESKKYLQNTITYTTLGDSYKTLGYFQKAERAYQIASDMIPSRFYAKYLLAKLYDETGQKNKALRIAKELLQMKVKVGSLAIHEIHEAMEQLILRHQMPESTYRNKGLYEPGLLCYSEKQIVIST